MRWGHKYRERFEVFGLDLETFGERWLGEDATSETRSELYQAVLFALMDVLLPAARALSLDNATREHGLGLYRTLIRFFVEHRTKVPDVEYFGAIPSVLEVAFPLLLTRNIDEIEMGYFVDAAHAVARVDRSFGHDDLRDNLIDVGVDNRGTQPSSSSTQIGVSAPVRLESRKISVTRSIFRAYFGVEFFYESMLAILSFLGIKRTGQMTMTTDDIVVASVVRLGKQGHSTYRRQPCY